MSQRESKRRRIAKEVMRKAWSLFKRCILSWGTCLKITWGTVRCLTPIYHSKVRGTSFENRQQILKRLSLYPANDISLKLERDIGNQYDANAIKVIAEVKNKGAATVGYVSKELASILVHEMNSGKNVIAIFDSITGTDRSGYFGLNFSYILI